MSMIAVIPIRFGSKGIPNKNIRELAGKPLVQWTIEHCLKIESVSRVIVSTDSEEYAQVCKKLGAEILELRPSKLAKDESSTESVMLHTDSKLKELGYNYEYMLLAQATCPIRTPDLAERCFQKLCQTHADSILTVTETPPFQWFNKSGWNADYDIKNRPRRQDLHAQRRYSETGSVYITSREILISQENRLGGKIEVLVTSKIEGIDIDDEIDWCLAEAILNSNPFNQ
jgi:N-acylneuraminate cytidylyltransferase